MEGLGNRGLWFVLGFREQGFAECSKSILLFVALLSCVSSEPY